METQHKTKSQWKLTRTQSSLRSSQTVRSSSIQSSPSSPFDDETNKKNRKITDSNRFSLTLISSSMILFYFFFYCYFSKAEIPTSENLLLALIFIAVVLYFVYKYQNHLKDMLIRFGYTHASSKRVMWFIGDDSEFMKNTERFSVREGVAFYGTGDFYEGEFNKGKCNGSGVYHYFANGSYEGDWVDGRYDGYGVESWAKGSRYRGMYRNGMRHGYGVYRFYTGDVYAGEWCNGQSHGVGVQSCCDGSCYVGEFKFGVKHGFGSYHFRIHLLGWKGTCI